MTKASRVDKDNATGVACMQAYFPDYLDRGLRIHAYWADCELLIAKDAPAAAAIWEGVLKTAAGKYADTWVGYLTMLVGAGSYTEGRKVYKRVYSRPLEEHGQVMLCEAWTRFEREHGTAETLFTVGFSAFCSTTVVLAQTNSFSGTTAVLAPSWR